MIGFKRIYAIMIMKMPQFRSYINSNGKDEFKEFYQRLPVADQRKLAAAIMITEEKGLVIASRLEIIKKLEHNLFELRSQRGSNIQRALYFHVVDDHYVITHGFTKKTQKTPRREVEHAKTIRAEFNRRKKV